MANVYGIYNLKTQKIEYVGQTINSINNRWHEHKSQGKRGKGVPFDRYMAKQGFENFQIIRLEECYECQLKEKEKYFIELLKPKGNIR